MLIGLISDSHDNLDMLQKAVNLFNSREVNLVLHAGDFIAPFTVSALDGLNCDWKGVFGNCDGEREGLTKTSNGKVKTDRLTLELSDKKVLLVHNLSRETAPGGQDLVVHGHTHKTVVGSMDKGIHVNPGECCGWVTGKATVAVVNTEKMKCEVIEL